MRERLLGLDGLRGLAVAAVVVYHTNLGILSGGFLGVDIFFVLSGFIITTLLLNECADRGRISLTDFYARRIRRLVPALVVLLAVVFAVTGLLLPDAAYSVKQDGFWALGFALNWHYVVQEQSYFMSMARPPMLQHLWSLAIEEQFYIVWPLVLIALTRVKSSLVSARQAIFAISSLGAVAITVNMSQMAQLLHMPNQHDPTRLYFGTDTHSMGLLVGCAFAATWNFSKLHSHVTPDRRTALHIAGMGLLAGLWALVNSANEQQPWLYNGGFFAISVLVGLFIVLAAHPGLKFAAFIGNPLFRWFGDRSYGIYIWHWPIFMMLRPGTDLAMNENYVQVLRILLLLAISDISYRLIERPMRQQGLRAIPTILKLQKLRAPRLGTAIASVAACMIASSSMVGMAIAQSPDSASVSSIGGITSVDEDPTIDAQALTQVNNGVGDVMPANASVLEAKPTYRKIVVFGDSVVLSGRIPLKETLGKISIDAAVGRQPSVIAQRINKRRDEGRLGDEVVIHMGTNGIVTLEDIAPILDSLRDRKRVVVVNVQVPRVWMKPSNEIIETIASQYPNVRLANWQTTSKGHRGYFAPDGVHLTQHGGQAFAELIKQALNSQ